jgi:hypothetical protein
VLNLSRISLPDIKTYVDRVSVTQLDLDFAADDAERAKLEDTKTRDGWRALRIATRTKLALFEKIDDSGSLERLIDKEDSQITDVNENQDVEGITNEGSGSLQTGDPAENSGQPADSTMQEANSS